MCPWRRVRTADGFFSETEEKSASPSCNLALALLLSPFSGESSCCVGSEDDARIVQFVSTTVGIKLG